MRIFQLEEGIRTWKDRLRFPVTLGVIVGCGIVELETLRLFVGLWSNGDVNHMTEVQIKIVTRSAEGWLRTFGPGFGELEVPC